MSQSARRIPVRPGANADERSLHANVNKAIAELQDQINALKDRPSLKGDLDMNGFRVTNVGLSSGANDVVPRKELEDKALFENSSNQHVAHSVIISKGGIRTKIKAQEPDELVPLRQVKDLVAAGVGTAPSDAFTLVSNFFGLIAGDNNHNIELTVAGNLRHFNRLIAPANAGVSGFVTTGTTPPPAGFLSVFINESAFTLKLIRAAAGFSTAAARFEIASDVLIQPYRGFLMLYSAARNRWLLIQV